MCGWLTAYLPYFSGSLTFCKVPELSFLDMVLDMVQPISNFFIVIIFCSQTSV